MTSHHRRWARQLRKEACAGGDLRRVAEDHVSNSREATSFCGTLRGPRHIVYPLLGHLRVVDDHLEVHYGPWWFDTPLSNVADMEAAGDRVCLTFHQPVHGHEPVGVRHRTITVTVDDSQRLARCLREHSPDRVDRADPEQRITEKRARGHAP